MNSRSPNVRHIEVPESPHISSVGYDPETSTLELDWIDVEAVNWDPKPATRRRYGSVPSICFARIILADPNEMAVTAAKELRGAKGVVVEPY